MTTTSKVILWILGVVVVVGLGVWYWMSQQPASTNNAGSYGNTSQTAPANGTATANNNQAGQDVSATDSSDAALANDMANVDTQMNGLNNDSANADAGMNDQPVAQPQ